jgi:hypothetical protein
MSDIYRTAPVPTLGESYEIGRAHGVRAEQERIIKLLTDCECHPEDEGNCFAATYVCDVIALIKGKK